MRSRSSAVLLALAVVAPAPSLGMAQYTPKWHVGDWWVVKTWQIPSSCVPEWTRTRYEVAGIEKVHHRDCFVLEVQDQNRIAVSEGDKFTYYVRADTWLVVMLVFTRMYDGKLRSDTLDRPRGMFGPFQGGEQRLPRFPLRIGDVSDTTFRLERRDDCAAYLREISGVADTGMVKRLLADGYAVGERVLRPGDVVYQVREEMGSGLGSDSLNGGRSVTQSLQLWCLDQPWRLYEELAQYDGPKLARRVIERSWLVASGRGET